MISSFVCFGINTILITMRTITQTLPSNDFIVMSPYPTVARVTTIKYIISSKLALLFPSYVQPLATSSSYLSALSYVSKIYSIPELRTIIVDRVKNRMKY